MEDTSIITILIPVLNLAVIVGLVVMYFLKGGNQASSEAITTYKAAVDAYEVRLKQTANDNVTMQKEMVLIKEKHRAEIEMLHQDIEKLRILMQEQEKKYQAILIEKDKQIAGITLILQNRDPESMSVQKKTAEFMASVGVQISDIHKIVVRKTT